MPLRAALSFPLLLPSLVAQDPAPDLARFQEASRRLAEASQASDVAYQRLAWLCDRIGHRLAGSPQLDQAIAWAAATLKADGFQVRLEKVKVPRWVRGAESAELLVPSRQRLHVLGLGGTVPTPKGGLTAEVVVVGSFDELKALGAAKVKGRIVCFDVPFTGYGPTVAYRSNGAIEAAKLGAAGVLVRSVSPVSLDTPHTGAVRYEKSVPRIPAAALTLEGATHLRRLASAGQRLRVRLDLQNQTFEDVESANVVADLPGREKPEEIVLLGGHLDSWDVGQGAQDDGVGCLNVWEAVRLIKQLGLQPRRTLRVVLFTNEENGLRGGLAYAKDHAAELPRHVAMLESDSGNGAIQGFSLDLGTGLGRNRVASGGAPDPARQAVLARLRRYEGALTPLGAARFELGGSGADIGPSVRQGVPGLGVEHDVSRYWDVHHTWADTFDKVDKATMQKNIAALATLAYILADMPETLR